MRCSPEYQLPESEKRVSDITFNKTSVTSGQPELTYSNASINSLTQIEQLHHYFAAFKTSDKPQPELAIS